jgi:hypothetical protein
MAQGKRIFTFAIVIVIAAFLQVILVFADCRSTASRSAVAFTKAYYQLDPSMTDWLCSEITVEEGGAPVADYLYRSAEQAREMGYSPAALKSTLYHVATRILSEDDATARVRVTAERKQASNPVFAWVAKIFFLGNTYEVDKTLDLVRENGRWKVCGAPFAAVDA